MDSFDWKKSLGGLGIVLVLGTIGLFAKSQARTGSNSDDKAKSTYNASKNKEADSREEGFDYSAPYKTIKVDISGQIAEPGVYEITEGSRLDDLVKLAGGLKAGADRDAVNLSVKLQDEQKIVILAQNQSIGLDDVASLNGSIRPLATGDIDAPRQSKRSSQSKSKKYDSPAKANSDSQATTDDVNNQSKLTIQDILDGKEEPASNEGKRQNSPKTTSQRKLVETRRSKVSLNRASLDELDSLPGVGPAIAKRIFSYRQSRGSFSSIDELRNVKGIGTAVFKKISPWLTL